MYLLTETSCQRKRCFNHLEAFRQPRTEGWRFPSYIIFAFNQRSEMSCVNPHKMSLTLTLSLPWCLHLNKLNTIYRIFEFVFQYFVFVFYFCWLWITLHTIFLVGNCCVQIKHFWWISFYTFFKIIGQKYSSLRRPVRSVGQWLGFSPSVQVTWVCLPGLTTSGRLKCVGGNTWALLFTNIPFLGPWDKTQSTPIT